MAVSREHNKRPYHDNMEAILDKIMPDLRRLWAMDMQSSINDSFYYNIPDEKFNMIMLKDNPENYTLTSFKAVEQ